MAHFAKLDGSNIVITGVVIGDDVPTSDGPLGENDMHVDGETYCVNLFKTGEHVTWKQTSYTDNFRKQYAGPGYTYDPVKDIFIRPQPYPSWSLDSNNDWQSPVPYPTEFADKFVKWDEDNQQWIAQDIHQDPIPNFEWDASALSWTQV
tara:strand:- start:64 stop:510 length:447 start_codon:yes stop_codon:yes gene_type:complete